MAAQLYERGRIWWLRILRRRALLTAGLLFPALLAVGVVAGPGPATRGHPAAQLATTVHMIAGDVPLRLTPAGPGVSAGTSGRHRHRAPITAASGRAPGSQRAGQMPASGRPNSVGRRPCNQRSPAYRPGRVFAKGRADNQPGGPAPASAPSRPAGAVRPPGPAAATPRRPAAVRPPRPAAATPRRTAAASRAARPTAASRRGQVPPPRAVHVSHSQPTAGSLMRGIPQAQRGTG
jgi:hypothetical protein